MHEQLFQFLSYAPGPFWLLILCCPLNRRAMLAYDAFLLLLVVLFTLQGGGAIGELLPLLAKPEFEPLYKALTTKEGFVASWNHMILGDLWIGRWVAQDSRHWSRPWLVRWLFLPPILFFGPMGLCAYLIVRISIGKRFALTETPAHATP
jgi:hypothetical protein